MSVLLNIYYTSSSKDIGKTPALRGRRQWHPTPALLPGKSHGWRSLVRCSPWGSLGVGHDRATSLSLFTFMQWRRKWQPTPVFLPGEFHGLYSPWDFDCVNHNKLWKILQEIRIPDHLTCLLRNLYAGQEATVRSGHETMNWFHIRKGVRQGCILSPCLFNFYAEYIM